MYQGGCEWKVLTACLFCDVWGGDRSGGRVGGVSGAV